MANTPAEVFEAMKANVKPEKVKGINATYQWDITGDNGGKWFATFSDADGAKIGEGQAENPNITITVAAQDWVDIVGGKLNPQMAFLTGKLKIQGDMTLAMKLQSITS